MRLSGIGYSNLLQLNGFCPKNVKEKVNASKSVEIIQIIKKTNLQDTIIAMAKRDAAKGEYMGKEFTELRQACVSDVSPDRSTAMLQVTSFMESGNINGYDHDKDIDSWMYILLGLPYKAEGVSDSFGRNTAQIYGENGEMIASYHWENGWTEVPTSAENARSDELKFAYYDAYCKARENMKKSKTLNTSNVSIGSVFNVQA